MKSILTYLFIGIVFITNAQNDSIPSDTNNTYHKYPNAFPNATFRFKPFLVSQSALAAEYEIYGKNRSRSFVIGTEAVLLQNSSSQVRGGAIELENRTYFDRSIYNGKNDEMLFYISYGVKFGTYDFYAESTDWEYVENDDPTTSWVESDYKEITNIVDERFNRLFVNLKVGLQYIAFKKISIDMNLGAGLWYNSKFIEKREVYSDYAVKSLLKSGIKPTMHLAIGLAN